MSLVAFQNHDAIVVGKPMPFSVYGADGKLLLAKDLPVTSERMREVILSQATYCVTAENDRGAAHLPTPSEQPSTPSPTPQAAATPATLTAVVGALADLRQQYSNDDDRSRFGLRIAKDETSESFGAFVIGVVNDKRYVILTSPVDKQGKLVPIAPNEVWLCRLFNATTVFRFMGRVIKVTAEPLPHLHIELPANIERRTVRRQPRALSSLAATLRRPDGSPAIIIDISTTGVRLAVDLAVKLDKGALVPICTTIKMMDRLFELTVNGRVTAPFGASDPRYPGVHFYGVQFEDVNESAALVLHAYVQEQLTLEFDRLSRVLAIESAYDALGGK